MKKTKLPPILSCASDAEYVLPDSELRELALVIKILSGNNYVYGYQRGKYGTLTDNSNKKTYRIKSETFERLRNLV